MPICLAETLASGSVCCKGVWVWIGIFVFLLSLGVNDLLRTETTEESVLLWSFLLQLAILWVPPRLAAGLYPAALL